MKKAIFVILAFVSLSFSADESIAGKIININMYSSTDNYGESMSLACSIIHQNNNVPPTGTRESFVAKDSGYEKSLIAMILYAYERDLPVYVVRESTTGIIKRVYFQNDKTF